MPAPATATPSVLPPLSSVRVFEAAARHGSFTRAAGELHMTQAAVSYQVRQLEERLGAPLFVRAARGVTLTPLGAQLASTTTAAFDQLRHGFAQVQARSDRVLVVSTLPTIAASWLAPRLGAFQLQHPDLAVRLQAAVEPVDLVHEADVAIRSGTGRWPGLQAEVLFPNVFAPLCSPAFQRRHRLRTPQQLLGLPRIGRAGWWARWLRQVGLEVDADAQAARGVEFGVQQMEVASAIAGHGVAIASPRIFAPELAAQQLVQPFEAVATDGKDHWVVHAECKRSLPKVQAFKAWLLSQAAAMR